MSVFFGDIHTHTTFSDGRLDPPETLQRARSHLDFYALTDHVQLPDTPAWDLTTFRGRAIVQPQGQRWPEVQKLIRESHEPGKFVTFLAYEWSSMHWGDHNVYYLHDDQPIRYARSLAELHASLKGIPAMVIPHHTAYPPYHRGYNWEGLDTSLTPFTEVFSGHGCSESDTGPNPIRSIMGPRCWEGTAQRALELGNIVGFIASTDDHSGHPGSYGRGLCAAIASELTRAALWDAFWKRRVYGLTGDRIKLDFRLNDQIMGSVVTSDRGKPRQIQAAIDAWDCLEQVEIIKNNRTVKRWSEFENAPVTGAQRLKLGVEWGYYEAGTWKFAVQVENGRILGHNLHFGPPSANRITTEGPNQREISPEIGSKDSGSGQVDLDIQGGPQTTVMLLLGERLVLSETIGALMTGSKAVLPFGPYRGWLRALRPIWEPQFLARLEWQDRNPEGPRDFYYLRATQKNGQMCWSSPIWVIS